MDNPALNRRLDREKRARLEAEKLLELKSAELFAANQKLNARAESLTEHLESKEKQYEAVKSRADVLTGENARARSDLEKANEAAFQAERRLWDAVKAIPDGFAIFDVNDRLVAANDAYVQMWASIEDKIKPGVKFEALVRASLDVGLVGTNGVDPEEWINNLIAVRRRKTQTERIVKRKNGTWIKASEQRSETGDVVDLQIDVTGIKKREEELNIARKTAEAANRAKSAFLANMSHEIRTPMNGVVGMADLLCETPLDDEQRMFAETIKNSGEALLVIINDVLDYSKIEAERLELFTAPFDLETCVHEVVTLLQSREKGRNLDLLIDYDIFLPTQFIGDVGRIRQILMNLVGNAVKFTREGLVLVRVVGVENAAGTREIHVAVEDTGIGIPADAVGKVFGEFSQVEEEANRRFEGTGLGLAITERLIELMGGEIWVESELGKGSCFGFKLTLPVGSDHSVQPIAAGCKFKRALVVDDLRVNRVILERQLNLMRIEVDCFSGGTDALQHLAGGVDDNVDLVLTDHLMPEMDGIEFAKRLQAQRPDLPVVLLSSAGASQSSDGEGPTFAAFMQKPIMRRDLFNTIRALSGQNAVEQQRAVAPSPSAPVGLAELRILAAEDNKTNQLVLRKMLGDQVRELHFAENGRIAVSLYEEHRPDLVFMDISMPEMDGMEATTLIRGLENRHKIEPVPIIALTAHAMAGDKEKFIAAGMTGYLTKPLKKGLLLDAVHSACLNEFEFDNEDAKSVVATTRGG